MELSKDDILRYRRLGMNFIGKYGKKNAEIIRGKKMVPENLMSHKI